MATDPLVPRSTPFNYNVGINYETWEAGRTGYSIPKDLQQITQNFKLIKTFHDVSVWPPNSTSPTIDPTQQKVITFVKNTTDVELVMGTNNNALAILDDNGWKPGLMYSRAYTDKWVEMLIESFGNKTQVKQHLKTILLANEIDMYGPPPGSAQFKAYYSKWIPQAFDNVQASLAKYGLGGIPVSTTIANYGPGNVVSVEIPIYIKNHWKDSWNNGKPFVFFNQYTQGFESTDFKHVENYFESVQAQLPGALEVFIGETGYSSYFGDNKQANVLKELFNWLDGMGANGGKSVPLFVFDAYDRPSHTYPPFEVNFGIYKDTAKHQPAGLKPDLVSVVPAWTTKAINVKTLASNAFHGTDAIDEFNGGSGDDYLFGGGGNDLLRGAANDDILEGGDGADTLLGADGSDVAYGGTGGDRIGGGNGRDYIYGDGGRDGLYGGRGDDTLSGGRGIDDLRGDAGDDLLDGGSGTDTLRGGGGDDSMVGGYGDDFINGGSGSDTAFGGVDDDTFVVETLGDLVVEFEGQGIDQVRIADLSAYTLGPNIEEGVLLSDAGDALLRGNELDNLLIGNEYDNVLLGMAGDDFLKGRDGDDTLNGGGGANRLRGGSGDDLMRLQRSDRVWGGSGADTFLFNDDEGVSGKLVFEDFVGRNQAAPGEADSLVFATGLESGSFSYIGDAAFSAGGNSEARFAGGERLEIDNDGDGAADMAATVRGLTGPNQLTATDFVWL